MDFFNKLKDIGRKKTIKEETSSLNENNNIDDSKNDFTYFERLINGADKKVVLDRDIILDDSQAHKFLDGIKIDNDNLIIDGQHHIIDAKSKTRIFRISGNNVILKNIKFLNGNYDKGDGGSIYIASNSVAEIKSCLFENNSSSEEGGAIYNEGNCQLFDCKFFNNNARYGGALLNNVSGNMHIKNSIFKENNSHRFGGAIANDYNITIEDSKFISNTAYSSSILINNVNSKSSFENCNFMDNNAQIENNFINFGNCIISDCNFLNHNNRQIALINNAENLEVYNSNFSNNSNEILIKNINSVKIFKSKFENNESRYLLHNKEYASLSISYTSFLENKSEQSVIYTSGKTYINDSKFENDKNDCLNIHNESDLNFKVSKLNHISPLESVINNGHLKIWGLNKTEADSLIKENTGEIEIIEPDDDNPFNFKSLDNLINSSNDNVINLKDSFSLNEFERLFYEGGIDLNVDNLVIKGNGNSIDAKNKSRIFLINAKNVVLENIVFKNGNLYDEFDSFNEGGGALKILKGKSLVLKDCKFIGNESNKNGGVIFNKGKLYSCRNSFENNKSKFYGGAIYNQGICTSQQDNFEKNSSKLGGAIYNRGKLNLTEFICTDNYSNIGEPVFNSNLLEINDSDDLNELVYNIGEINKIQNNESISLKEFNERLNKKYDEIILYCDVKYDPQDDSRIYKEINIEFDELTIDGLDNSIDLNYNEFSINVTGKKITFKNITFRNANLLKNQYLINNDGDISFENCKFINNISFNDNAIIENNGSMNICNSIFFNNLSKTKGIISNNSQLKIRKTKALANFSDGNSFIFNSNNADLTLIELDGMNNSSKTDGGLIKNFGSSFIENSGFIDNFARGSGGVIFNNQNGISTISKSNFISNGASAGGGVIYNEGIFELKQSYLIRNKSLKQHSGGVIINAGDLKIKGSTFFDNASKRGGCINNSFGGYLKVFNTIFQENRSVEAAVLINYDYAKFVNCNIKDNVAIKSGVISSENDATFDQSNCIFENNLKGDFNYFKKW